MGRPRAASKDGIVEAAIAVFRERGYEGTTIPAIAGRAGISQGTIYNYFPSKERLLVACSRAAGTPGSIFRALRERVGEEPVEDLLSDAAAGVARFLELRLPAMLMLAAGGPRPGRPGVEYPRRALESARDYFAAEMDAGRIRRGDAEALALGFLGGLFYASFFERAYGLPRSFERPREDTARAWAREVAAGLVLPAAAA